MCEQTHQICLNVCNIFKNYINNFSILEWYEACTIETIVLMLNFLLIYVMNCDCLVWIYVNTSMQVSCPGALNESEVTRQDARTVQHLGAFVQPLLQ
jgi:hypothetical protein